jgi:hypothetical protein
MIRNQLKRQHAEGEIEPRDEAIPKSVFDAPEEALEP